MDKDKLEEALDCYIRTIELNPKYAEAWFNKGNVLFALDKIEEAILCFDRSLEIEPINAQGWNNKGVALETQARRK